MFVTMPKDHPRNTGVSLPDGRDVQPGDTVEVDDAYGAGLIDQGWKEASKTAAAKAAKEAAEADTTTDAPAGADTEEP